MMAIADRGVGDPVTIKRDGDFFVDGGRSMHLCRTLGRHLGPVLLVHYCW